MELNIRRTVDKRRHASSKSSMQSVDEVNKINYCKSIRPKYFCSSNFLLEKSGVFPKQLSPTKCSPFRSAQGDHHSKVLDITEATLDTISASEMILLRYFKY